MRSLLFFLGPGVHKETLCVPSKSGVSVSPSPVEFLVSNPGGLQNHILWGFLLPLPNAQAEKPNMRLKTFSPVGEFLWYIYFPFCESPTRPLWDLTLLQLCPSYHLIVAPFLSLDVGYLFLVGSSIFFFFFDIC